MPQLPTACRLMRVLHPLANDGQLRLTASALRYSACAENVIGFAEGVRLLRCEDGGPKRVQPDSVCDQIRSNDAPVRTEREEAAMAQPDQQRARCANETIECLVGN